MRSNPHKVLVAAFVMLLGTSCLQAEESPLDKAKGQYDQSVAAARDKVVKYLEKAIVSLTKKDDLKKAIVARDWKQALNAEQTTISQRLQQDPSERKGEVPVPPALAKKYSVKKYLSALKSATRKLGSAYDKAISSYAKKGDLDNALALKEEKALFLLLTTNGANASSPSATAKKASGSQSTKKKKASSIPQITEGPSGLRFALKAFGFDRRGWKIKADYITGKCGTRQQFFSKRFKAKEVAFGFKIKAKECHGIIVEADGALYQYYRGDKKNTASRISIRDANASGTSSRLFPGSVVDKPNEFVAIAFTLKEDTITWYYDGELIRETDMPINLEARTIKVGFASDKTIVQLKDFSLTSK